MTTALAPTSHHDPDPLADVPAHLVPLGRALLAGLRWREAARLAGITPAHAYNAYAHCPALKRAVDVHQAQALPLADKRLDVLDAALSLGTDAPTDPKALGVALNAAKQVGETLGIGSGEALARARVAVAVSVHLDLGALASVLRLDAPPTLDARLDAPARVTLDLPPLPDQVPLALPEATEAPSVAATQPRRARSRSRRQRPERG